MECEVTPVVIRDLDQGDYKTYSNSELPSIILFFQDNYSDSTNSPDIGIMGSLTVLAGLIFMVFIMSVMLADSQRRSEDSADYDDPGMWNPDPYHDETKPNSIYTAYHRGEGCQGSPCQRKMCFSKSGLSSHMTNIRRYQFDQERHCYVIENELCKCLPNEDCVLTDVAKVVEKHVEYEYHCHPRPIQEAPLEEPTTAPIQEAPLEEATTAPNIQKTEL